jgi:hypothetical protein
MDGFDAREAVIVVAAMMFVLPRKFGPPESP